MSRKEVFYRFFLAVPGVVLLWLLVICALGIGCLVISLYFSHTFSWLQRPMQAVLNLLFPLALWMARLIHIDQDKVKGSYIEINNQLVRLRKANIKIGDILILVPHCLQNSACVHKITMDVSNCRRCGGCLIGSLYDLAERYGVHWAVATGGTLARKFVEKYQPRAIIAIACERDLASGIQDVAPLPVLGIVNIRPEGPCMNTIVDLKLVERAVNYFGV